MLRRFGGALPYLQLIARANGIADPFDARVVEAYWIGNSLLDGVEVRTLYDHLRERFNKQLSGRTRDLILGKAPAGARPHHSFHVFDIHSRLGELEHSLATLDNCRVSWGRVQVVDAGELVVERSALLLRDGKLVLGEPGPNGLRDRSKVVASPMTPRLGTGCRCTGAGRARCSAPSRWPISSATPLEPGDRQPDDLNALYPGCSGSGDGADRRVRRDEQDRCVAVAHHFTGDTPGEPASHTRQPSAWP